MRVLILSAILVGCVEHQLTAAPLRPDYLPGLGELFTAEVSGRTPFRVSGGEIVCGPDAAIGYRVTAAPIFALNGAGERLAQTAPFNRAWAPIEHGLRPDATPTEVQAMRALGASACRPLDSGV